MFFEKCLRTLLVLSFFFAGFILSAQDSTSDPIGSYYGIITKYTTRDENSKPVMATEETRAYINVNDRVYPGATLLTIDQQTIELVIYKNNNPEGIMLIMENTDFAFKYDEENKALDIRINYGGVRGVISKNVRAIFNFKTVFASLEDSDFCVVSSMDATGKRSGYLAVFGGEASFTSNLDSTNSETVKKLEISDFEEYIVYPPRNLTEMEIRAFQSNIYMKTPDIPEEINLVLEKLRPNEANETFLNKDETSDETKRPKFKYNKFMGGLLSFESGMLSYDKNIAIKFNYRPAFAFLEDRIMLGFYFPLNLIPSKVFTTGAFLPVNRNNNEWSFGSDQNGNSGAAVFDVFDDIFLKIRLFEYDILKDTIYLRYGDYFNLSDYLSYSMVDFNSSIFYPKLRKSSFLMTFKLTWFEAFVYAEDVLPKGLYGTDITFMTPAKSFRFRFRLSAYMDCYDLIQFNGGESYFPGQFNLSLTYTAFDVPSFGFSTFLSCGIFLPFTYNTYTGASYFQDLIGKNPASIAANLSDNIGFSLRINDFKFSQEFIIDSGLNRIGLFDNLYIAKRDNRKKVFTDWILDMEGRSININDFNFGFRTTFGYNYSKYFVLELQYQLTFPVYYDRLYFKIGYDSAGKYKVNFSIFTQWQIEKLASSFSDSRNFQENNIIFIGTVITPFPGIDINLKAGVIPDFINYNDPYYCQLLLDCYISINPIEYYKKKK